MFKKFLIFIFPVFLLLTAVLCFSIPNSAYAKDNKTVTVYYFYGKPRCDTCKKIEKYTKEAVEENFSKEIKSGKISFQAVDSDKPENKHFLNDYGLYTKAVIVSEKINGKEVKYKNLDKIWKLTNDEKQFKNYIKKEVKSSLEG